jgi:hypothetical protein
VRVVLPSGYVPGEVAHHDQWRWPRPYRRYAELLARGGELANVAEEHQLAFASVVKAVPDGAAALIVGHGGSIELALVACLPDANHDSGANRSATATAHTSASTRAGSSASSSAARRQQCCPGVHRQTAHRAASVIPSVIPPRRTRCSGLALAGCRRSQA